MNARTDQTLRRDRWARTSRRRTAAATASPVAGYRGSFSDAWRDTRQLFVERQGRLALGLALLLTNRLVGLVLPATSKILVDEVMGKGRGELLLPLALTAAAVSAVQAATGFALSQVLAVAAQSAITQLRRRVEAHIARLPIRYFDSNVSGVLISRIMSDAEGLRSLVGGGLVNLLGSAITSLAALCVLLYLNWTLTLVTLGLLAVFATGTSAILARLRPTFRERGRINAEVTGRLNEMLNGIRIVKTYTAEKREDLVFTRGVHRLFRNAKRAITGASALAAFSHVVIGLIAVVVILLGGRAVVAGTMTLGSFVLFVMFAGLTAAPLTQIAGFGPQVSEALASLDRIREVLKMSKEDAHDAELEPLGEGGSGEVTFEDVSFAYTPGVPVLQHVTFRTPAGSTTALVGSSGAGKSTLVSLVMAFNRPQSGVIRVDGRDLTTIRVREHRARLGVVLQGNFLFDGTIADNIRYGRPDATLDEVRAASRIAHADEFIEKFVDTYDTVIGERGVRLSGGQQQRVAIARAILADPRILVLDEATSSLDSESEALLQSGLRSLCRGRTTFVIAHRLSTIRSADQILVVEGGEIVERGRHAELLALNGRYRTLYDKQYAVEANRFINPGEEPRPPASELPPLARIEMADATGDEPAPAALITG